MKAISPGSIWIVRNLPTPQNKGVEKSRPLLIIDTQTVVPCGFRASTHGVAVTSSPSGLQLSNGYAVPLPYATKYEETQSGLDRPSWAVADWFVRLTACEAEKHLGDVSLEYVLRVRELVRGRKVKCIEQVCATDGAECDYCRGKPKPLAIR